MRCWYNDAWIFYVVINVWLSLIVHATPQVVDNGLEMISSVLLLFRFLNNETNLKKKGVKKGHEGVLNPGFCC